MPVEGTLPAIAAAVMAGALLAACERTPVEAIASQAVPAEAVVEPLRGGERQASGPVHETVTTSRIKAAIASDEALKGADIEVATDDGVVTLSGSASTQQQVSTATALAQRQAGVRRVENRISLSETPREPIDPRPHPGR